MGWFSIQYQVICRNSHLLAQDRKCGVITGSFLSSFFPHIQTGIKNYSFYTSSGLFSPTHSWKTITLATFAASPSRDRTDCTAPILEYGLVFGQWNTAEVRFEVTHSKLGLKRPCSFHEYALGTLWLPWEEDPFYLHNDIKEAGTTIISALKMKNLEHREGK